MSGADAVYRQAYDEVVRLGQAVRQRDHLRANLGAARARAEALQEEVDERAAALEREERDVQRLEDVSLARLLWSALGRREEKLDQERAEALAAELELDASLIELRAATGEVARLEAELAPLDGIEADYHRAFEAKVDRVLREGGAGAGVVRARLEALTASGELLREIDEALEMGRLSARHLRVAVETLEVMQEEEDAAMVVITTTLLSMGWGSSNTTRLERNLDLGQQYLQRFVQELEDVPVAVSLSASLRVVRQISDLVGLRGASKAQSSRELLRSAVDEVERVIGRIRILRSTSVDDYTRALQRYREAVEQA